MKLKLWVYVGEATDGHNIHEAEVGTDDMACTRRAIVRAAAAIGDN